MATDDFSGFDIEELDPAGHVTEILALWNRNLGDRFPLDSRLLCQQLALEKDDKVLLVARARRASGPASPTEPGGAREAGAADAPPLVGAALVKRRRRPDPDGSVPAVGNLSFILVDEGARRRGAGSALLSRAEAWLGDRAARILHAGRDRYHFFPGAPEDGAPSSLALAAFLEARGFVLANRETDLRADLGQVDLSALAALSPMPEGWRFSLYDDAMRDTTEAFFGRCFPGRWRDDILEALDSGMRPEDLGLLVEESSGEVMGFCRLYDRGSPVLGPGVYWRGLMGDSPCGLGPIGVDESRRGLGLGLALLRCGLEALAARGGRVCVIDWTDLESFYAKMGFEAWKRYRMASKELSWA